MTRVPIFSAVLLASALATPAGAEDIRAQLIGYHEVPSVSTPASGTFKARISADEKFIDYELT